MRRISRSNDEPPFGEFDSLHDTTCYLRPRVRLYLNRQVTGKNRCEITHSHPITLRQDIDPCGCATVGELAVFS